MEKIAGLMMALTIMTAVGAAISMWHMPTKARGGWRNG